MTVPKNTVTYTFLKDIYHDKTALFIGAVLHYGIIKSGGSFTMTLKEWNEYQIHEALDEINRYYLWKNSGNGNPTDGELILFYIQNRGAEHFRQKHEVGYDEQKEETPSSNKTP